MAIGISLYLLMYMWFKAMSGYSSGGYGHYVKRSYREKVRMAQKNKDLLFGSNLTIECIHFLLTLIWGSCNLIKNGNECLVNKFACKKTCYA